MAVKIDAYHGTDDNSTNSIIKNGFNPSIGNDQWIGDGTYFFIKGLSAKPELQAEKWAILELLTLLGQKVKHKNLTFVKV